MYNNIDKSFNKKIKSNDCVKLIIIIIFYAGITFENCKYIYRSATTRVHY